MKITIGLMNINIYQFLFLFMINNVGIGQDILRGICRLKLFECIVSVVVSEAEACNNCYKDFLKNFLTTHKTHPPPQ